MKHGLTITSRLDVERILAEYDASVRTRIENDMAPAAFEAAAQAAEHALGAILRRDALRSRYLAYGQSEISFG